MVTETMIFAYAAAGLIITEIILIISVWKLRQSIMLTNKSIATKFEEVSNKIKSLVELFIEVQTQSLKKKKE